MDGIGCKHLLVSIIGSDAEMLCMYGHGWTFDYYGPARSCVETLNKGGICWKKVETNARDSNGTVGQDDQAKGMESQRRKRATQVVAGAC